MHEILKDMSWTDILNMELVCRAWKASNASGSEELVVGHMTDSLQHRLQNHSSRLLSVAVVR